MTGLDDWLANAETLLAETRRAGLDRAMERAIAATVSAFRAGRPLLVCGNGGSAADAQHITGELVGRFLAERRAFKAICLAADPAVLTAWSNDYSFDTVFSRQVEAYGEAGGALLGISTSGNSRNVIAAFEIGPRPGHDHDRPHRGGRRTTGGAMRPSAGGSEFVHTRHPADSPLPVPLLLCRNRIGAG